MTRTHTHTVCGQGGEKGGKKAKRGSARFSHKKATARNLDCTGYVFARPTALDADLPENERGLTWEFESSFTPTQPALVAMGERLKATATGSSRRIDKVPDLREWGCGEGEEWNGVCEAADCHETQGDLMMCYGCNVAMHESCAERTQP